MSRLHNWFLWSVSYPLTQCIKYMLCIYFISSAALIFLNIPAGSVVVTNTLVLFSLVTLILRKFNLRSSVYVDNPIPNKVLENASTCWKYTTVLIFQLVLNVLVPYFYFIDLQVDTKLVYDVLAPNMNELLAAVTCALPDSIICLVCGLFVELPANVILRAIVNLLTLIVIMLLKYIMHTMEFQGFLLDVQLRRDVTYFLENIINNLEDDEG